MTTEEYNTMIAAQKTAAEEFDAKLAADVATMEAARKAEREAANPPQVLSPVMQAVKGQEAATEASQAATEAEPGEAAPEAPESQETASEADDEAAERIKRAYIEAREHKREAARLAKELAIARGEIKETPDEQVARLAAQQAQQIATQTAFNEQCNKIAEAGNKAYKDFMPTFNELVQTLGAFPSDLIEAAIEAGDAHKALHWLGKNLDEAERISKLPAARQGVAMAKIVDKLNAPKQKPISKTPAPIRSPDTGSAPVVETTPDVSKMTTAQAADYWDKQDRERRAKRLFH